MNFEFQYAPSGRASCKVCQGKIDKEALRIGAKQKADKEKTASGDGPSQMAHVLESTRWHHFRCFPRMRGVKWFKENLPEPSECTGFESLKEEDREHVVALFSRCRGVDVPLPQELLLPPASSVQDPATPAMDRKCRGQKRAGAESTVEAAEDADMSPEQKALKTNAKSSFSAVQAAELERQKMELSKKSIAQLGAMLAKNGMAKSGKKEELVDRVAECRILGAWPMCPRCEKVRLRFNRTTFTYSCPGHFDDDAKRMLRCKGPAKDAEVQRPAWQELLPLSPQEEVRPEATEDDTASVVEAGREGKDQNESEVASSTSSLKPSPEPSVKGGSAAAAAAAAL